MKDDDAQWEELSELEKEIWAVVDDVRDHMQVTEVFLARQLRRPLEEVRAAVERLFQARLLGRRDPKRPDVVDLGSWSPKVPSKELDDIVMRVLRRKRI
jgi:hypothetical protein